MGRVLRRQSHQRSQRFQSGEAGIGFGPAKAANAGGVPTSQLEMARNASMQQWTFEKVDKKLHAIMTGIFQNASETAKDFGAPGNLVIGAIMVSAR